MATHCTLLANNELYTTLNLRLCMCCCYSGGFRYDPVADCRASCSLGSHVLRFVA